MYTYVHKTYLQNVAITSINFLFLLLTSEQQINIRIWFNKYDTLFINHSYIWNYSGTSKVCHYSLIFLSYCRR